jgi:23S rRNA pseudouridine1911/1915/1917 synthase
VHDDVDMGETAHLDEHGRPRIIERRFVVDERFAGKRLDHFLKGMIPRLSRTKLQEVIRTQLEGPAGKPLKPSATVLEGERYLLRREARPEPPCPRTFEVLHEDVHMMVVDKPAGLPMHASARFYFNTLTRLVSERYPGAGLQICHRLDRETSGIVVLARGKDSAAVLKRAFENKRVQKTYLAVVHGQPPWPEADDPAGDHLIDLPLGLVEDPDARISIRMEVRDGALPAATRVRVLDRAGDVALVRCRPITGRQHQIRAHLAAAGYPIVGDKLYAHGDELFARYCDQGLDEDMLAEILLPRHALHAAAIDLRHPASGQEFQIDSPLPADLREFLQRAASGL